MPPRSVKPLWRAVAPLLVVGAIVLVFLPLTRAYDLDVFIRAGHAVLHGLRLYPRAGSRVLYSGYSFVYPYLAAWPFAPLATLTPGLGTAVFLALSFSAVIAATLLAAEGDPLRAVLVLCTSFTITGLQLGALSPLLFAGVVFLWRVRERPVGFALLAAPVVASKLFLAPLLVWLLLARRYRAFAWTAALTLALLGAGFALGPLGPWPYLHLLSQLGAHEARSGFGLIGALMNAGQTAAAAEREAILVAVLLLGCAYFHYRRSQDEAILFCAGIVASLVLTPVLWSHYLVLLAAALLALQAPRRWFVALAIASWAIAPPHGIHVDADLIEGVASPGAWLAVAGCIAVFVYAAGRTRGRLH